MDTGSHLLFGVTLAGLAMVDPTVAGNAALAQAVLAGTLIGSHAPDFDTLTRLKGYSAYIRHHRGAAHSLPALILWPALLSLPLAWGFGVMDQLGHVYLWVLAAVVWHVLLDLLNVYGVQCLRPFSKAWLHLDVLPLFDPFLFAAHGLAAGLWAFGAADPRVLFPIVYGVTFLYIGMRGLHHRSMVRLVKNRLSDEGGCQVIPSLHWFHWQFVVETERCFYTGSIRYRQITIQDRYGKMEETPAIRASMRNDGVRAFLGFAQRILVTCSERPDGYEVQWRDVRFWHNHKLPFGVDVRLDRDMQVQNWNLGWRKRSWDPPYV